MENFEQLSLFDFINETNGEYKFPKDKKIRLIELFGGIGSQSMAMERLNPPMGWEHYRLVEFDKYPVTSYNAIHGTDFPTMDITQIHGWDLGIVDKDKYSYLLCYSFPCQDISVAGLTRGFNKDNQKNDETRTRSGLLWEVERLLDETPLLPDVLLMENVANIVSKTMMPDFQKWLDYLETKGYSSFYNVMNAADYGVAQSRKRCFCVSVLGNHTYKFPKPIPLTKVMKDYLEDDVDEKYYIKSERAKELIEKLIVNGKILTDRQTDRQTDRRLTCPHTTQNSLTLQTACPQDRTEEFPSGTKKEAESLKPIGCLTMKKHQSTRVYDPDGLGRTVDASEMKHPQTVLETKKILKEDGK